MFDNPLVVLGVCGLAVVCVVAVVGVFFFVFRATDGVFDFFSLLNNASQEDDDDSVRVRPRANLRGIAKNSDFDSAVAKHLVQNDQNLPNLKSGRTASSTRLDAARRSSLRPERNRGESDNYSNDEIFGGILDEDGDGSVDNDRL